MSRRAEIQVGLTVLVAIAILVVGIAWLKDYSLERDTRIYHVIFSQAGGLAANTEVQVNGIPKGTVSAIHLVGDHVEMDLKMSKDVTLTTASRVAVRNVGLMGERMVSVDLSTQGRPYRSDETVIGIYEVGPGEMMGQLSGTVDAVSAISAQMRRLADTLNKDDRLARAVLNLAEASQQLHDAVQENRAAVTATLRNFQDASRTAKHLTTDREDELRLAMDHFGSAAENLDRLTVRIDSLRASVQIIASQVQSGQGTVGKLVNDERLYHDLNQSVQSLNELITDVKEHPHKYLKFSVF